MTDQVIFDTDLENYNSAVLQASHGTPILVDFWADWCPPCISLDPVLKKLVSASNGALRLARVEVDAGDNMKLAGQYQLRGFPTIILFINGEERARFSGFKSDEQIRDFLVDAGIEL